mgnify:CR=1 FL=1
MKTITLRCDGKDCTLRIETVCDSLTTDVLLPGWLRRKVVDDYTGKNAMGGTRTADKLYHYCPACIPTLVPPIHEGLELHRQVDLKDG